MFLLSLTMPSRAATRAAGVALDALMAEASAVVVGLQLMAIPPIL